MGGRIEEIINNKFYFVLDEVGASDGESELAHENLHLKVNLVDNNHGKYSSTPMDKKSNIIKDKNFHSSLSRDDSDKAGKPVEKTSSAFNQKLEVPLHMENIVDPTSNDTLDVVDMDVYSEGECEDSAVADVEPLATITFRDHSALKWLKPSLMKFFNQKNDECDVVSSDDNALELKVYKKNVNSLLKEDLLSFDLDTTPTNFNYCEVPHYGKNHDFVLSDKGSQEQNIAKVHALSKTTCFNCMQNHNLKDCDQVKDFRIINRNRQLFLSEMKMLKVSRYHLDEAQRFSDIQPGVISTKLRSALCLKHDQQPAFIYRMRLLGYPPAWLEEAKVSHSGVAMYDSTGIPVLEDDEEEGEIIPEGSKDKFDITKIIEFPGFNVPLPENYKEEAKSYGCPEMSEQQSKQNLIQLLKPKTVQAYVKKSLTTLKSDNQQPENVSKVHRPSSPTIEEMEEKKRQLLMELDDVESSPISKINFDDSSSGTGTEMEGSQSGDGKEPGTVRNSEFGTPILKSISPFSKLPSREQFSVNVSDIINFENLPNSTGKYETMRHVITKIRISTSKTQNK